MPAPGPFPGPNVAEVLAELERERRKNAELQGRVTRLEAKLGSDDKLEGLVPNGLRKSKKQRKPERTQGESENEDGQKIACDLESSLSSVKEEREELLQLTMPLENVHPLERQDTGVNWMSREEVTSADLEKLSKDIASERDDSGDSDDDDDDEEDGEDEFDEDDGEEREDGGDKKKLKVDGSEVWKGVRLREELKGVLGVEVKVETGKEFSMVPCNGESDRKKKRRKKKLKDGRKGKRGERMYFSRRGCGNDHIGFRGPGITTSYKKAPKTAFCPKEVKRIMESGVLALKNAQSHTMRKIIIFASLGIRHGCEDLYELDFNHFSIVRRGEPYKSPKDPGEHVLYNHPGVRTKMFYPNRHNPILCPLRILDEEKAMRPAGPSCPSCLFLCIKYGGRTRNLPQNEYVRQRMGRNKLKSFGPLMCQMALLVHIRTGSFFFKALGITLLFMAGFPDDLVRKETKYRNLDLLQKYYWSDEDAVGEQLFHPYPPFLPQAVMIAPPVALRNGVTGSKVVAKKGPPPLLSKPPTTHTVSQYLQPLSARAPTTTPFRGPALIFPPSLCPVPTVPHTSSAITGTPSPPAPCHPPPPPFGLYPPYPPVQRAPGGFPPIPVWPPVNSYPHAQGPYAAPPYAYQPFSHSSQYGSQPFYGLPYGYLPFSHQQTSKKELKKEAEVVEDSDSDTDSSSSRGDLRSKDKGNSSDSKEAE